MLAFKGQECHADNPRVGKMILDQSRFSSVDTDSHNPTGCSPPTFSSVRSPCHESE